MAMCGDDRQTTRTRTPFSNGVLAFAVLCALALLAMSGFARPAFAAAWEDGVYEVNVSAVQASSDNVSMLDGALSNPATLSVKDSQATLRFSLVAVDMSGVSGYLGRLQYFPGWADAGQPSASDAVAAKVVEVYDVVDGYNGPASSDSVMKGVSYPKTVSIGWDLSADTHFIRAYVPIMAAINPSSGWQFARLHVDYATMKKVGEAEDIDEGDDPASMGDPASAAGGPGDPGQAGDSSGSGSTDDTGSSTTDGSGSSSSSSGSKKLKFSKLDDGVYTVTGSVVKADRSSSSMADAAVSHTVELTVKKGSYSLALTLASVNMGGIASYLGSLSYYKTGYSKASDGAPQGSTGSVKVLSYQESSTGSRVTDRYGSNYPRKVSFPLIKEAKSDGYVPLRAFIPAMDAIAAGTGTQSMYLKLDRSSVAVKGTSDDASDDSGSQVAAAISSASGGSSMLSANTLPTASSPAASEVLASSLPDEETRDSLAALAGEASASQKVYSLSADASEETAKEPPLKGAVLPVVGFAGGAVLLGVLLSAFRHREWML